MEIILMNMCMVHDKENNKVVVLEKLKKEGWEGLTFPGGHLEFGESLYDSCIREVYEETGLSVKDLQMRGIVHWEHPETEIKQIGFLYYTSNFKGQLIEECSEGQLYWMDLEEFLSMEGKSDSMDDMLKIYMNDKLSEAMAVVGPGELDFEYF